MTMVAFYATSFDSIALTASCYSYHRLEEGQQPHKGIQLLWCILLILLPIALLFAESSMTNLQSVSIVGGVPHRHRHCDDRRQLPEGRQGPTWPSWPGRNKR